MYTEEELIEVGKNRKRYVTPLNKELYDFATETLYKSADNKEGYAWHIGSEDISYFINELEKRYDITPKQER